MTDWIATWGTNSTGNGTMQIQAIYDNKEAVNHVIFQISSVVFTDLGDVEENYYTTTGTVKASEVTDCLFTT